MNQVNASQEEKRRPLGTLACITTGFEVVARNPELIVLPFLLDLFLWLGPRLSVAPIVASAKAFAAQAFLVEGLPAEVTDTYAGLGKLLDEFSQGFDLFSVLNPGPLLGVPVLMPGRLSVLRPMGERPAIEMTSVVLMGVWMGLLAVLGLALNAIYLRAVGRNVIRETESPLPGPDSPWVLWRRLVKLGLVLFGGVTSVSILLSVFVGLVGLFSLPLAGLLMTLVSSMALFMGVHLAFTVPGIVQLRRGLLSAVRESLLLTRSDFLNVILLLALVLVISRGLNVVWTLPEPNTWSTAVGLLGHAFVSTALTAALLIFYQERLHFLEALKRLYAAQTQEAKAHPLVGK